MITLIFQIPYFYPRSPCGERQPKPEAYSSEPDISIHALLAESDVKLLLQLMKVLLFLSTLSLRRATPQWIHLQSALQISIHALLAESDYWPCVSLVGRAHFYPRSPCGERQKRLRQKLAEAIISIHALLAESDSANPLPITSPTTFLSTLSLRRATLATRQ